MYIVKAKYILKLKPVGSTRSISEGGAITIGDAMQ
jgi:hypothetical protein